MPLEGMLRQCCSSPSCLVRVAPPYVASLPTARFPVLAPLHPPPLLPDSTATTVRRARMHPRY